MSYFVSGKGLRTHFFYNKFLVGEGVFLFPQIQWLSSTMLFQ